MLINLYPMNWDSLWNTSLILGMISMMIWVGMTLGVGGGVDGSRGINISQPYFKLKIKTKPILIHCCFTEFSLSMFYS